MIVAFHLCSASICFGLSALYHTLMNCSAHSSDLWGRIDYTGIIILILGDFVSGIYVGFYCEPILQNTYWTMVRISLNSFLSLRDVTDHQMLIRLVPLVP